MRKRFRSAVGGFVEGELPTSAPALGKVPATASVDALGDLGLGRSERTVVDFEMPAQRPGLQQEGMLLDDAIVNLDTDSDGVVREDFYKAQTDDESRDRLNRLSLSRSKTYTLEGRRSRESRLHSTLVQRGFDETSTEAEPFSTFSLHVSDVSFKLAQAALAKGEWPETNQVRIEEFVNAFDYGDPVPSSDAEKVGCRAGAGHSSFLAAAKLATRRHEHGCYRPRLDDAAPNYFFAR